MNDFVLLAVDDNIIDKCNNMFNGFVQKQSVKKVGLVRRRSENKMCKFQITHNFLGDGLRGGGLLGGVGVSIHSI